MKRLITGILFLSAVSFSLGQTGTSGDPVETEEVEITVDETPLPYRVEIIVDQSLYPKTYPAPYEGQYFAEDGKAGISASVRKLGLSDFLENIDQVKNVSGLKFLDYQELNWGGEKVLFTRFEQNRGGDLYILTTYIRGIDNKHTMSIGSFHELEKDTEEYKDAIMQAAKSAKAIKQ